jgi:aspartyl-tRNA(Asn)/glutamyl-tRNA(Gln) amidotransferase subunit C
MPFHDDEVRRIADLARLEIDDAAVAHLSPQVATILDHVASLKGLDVDGVEPMVHPGSSAPPRDDEVSPSLAVEDALSCAPAADGGYFVVPRVLRP